MHNPSKAIKHPQSARDRKRVIGAKSLYKRSLQVHIIVLHPLPHIHQMLPLGNHMFLSRICHHLNGQIVMDTRPVKGNGR